MDTFLLGNLAFAYAFQQVRPAVVMDKLIELAVDILTPGKGTGQSNWWMKGLRNLEQRANRTSRELDIRSNLRRWDEEFPYLHHEVIVRYAAGFLASSFVLAVYDSIRGARPSRRR
mmetsp:Transcript_25107/g.36886  ORF Transcript_25107/g.36886 Transcript_25107/m.36886 type:complete len:116 (+) Transcript_25107:177-524(+)|eukprot:CAMPEP_0195530324 /NCGR_PEP_ID=MMETSP0794_2-20130614/33179_1 /TAXON_ID=515487 /ORGANISM="Stephanopyxis turris, Strain CCMP 815" /LENGTH=115 /DNA_ID=CAMNT_0040661809 /DNA_START=177 /DNA_END=524 /DNA_ORIENTATION=-